MPSQWLDFVIEKEKLFNSLENRLEIFCFKIAFGLHTNTVMDPEAKLSTYLSHILRLNNELFINPFLNVLKFFF